MKEGKRELSCPEDDKFKSVTFLPVVWLPLSLPPAAHISVNPSTAAPIGRGGARTSQDVSPLHLLTSSPAAAEKFSSPLFLCNLITPELHSSQCLRWRYRAGGGATTCTSCRCRFRLQLWADCQSEQLAAAGQDWPVLNYMRPIKRKSKLLWRLLSYWHVKAKRNKIQRKHVFCCKLAMFANVSKRSRKKRSDLLLKEYVTSAVYNYFTLAHF